MKKKLLLVEETEKGMQKIFLNKNFFYRIELEKIDFFNVKIKILQIAYI